MPVIINGSTGISGTDGSAGTPAVQGTDTNTGMFFPAADQIAFAEGGVEAMRLDASGNVGIGTTTPTSRLHVQSPADSVITNTAGSGSSWFAGTNTSAYILHNVSNTPMLFTTNGTERARITAAGDFQFNSGYGSVATAFGCRAWVNFNGTGTVAIRASGNVSSITDNGVGAYGVNFASALPDTNYSVTITNNNATSDAGRPVIAAHVSSATTGASVWTVGTFNNNTFIDCSVISVAIFR